MRSTLLVVSAAWSFAAMPGSGRAAGLPAFPPEDFAARLPAPVAAPAVRPGSVGMSWSRFQSGVTLSDPSGRTNLAARPGLQGSFDVNGVAGGESVAWRAVSTGRGTWSVFAPGLYAAIAPYRNDWDSQGRYGFAVTIRADAGESVILARSVFDGEPRNLAVREKGMELSALLDRQGGRLEGSCDESRASARDVALLALLLALSGL